MPKKKQDDSATVEIIRMKREPPEEGGPVFADVHPDSVEEYSRFGWRVVET